MIHPQIPGGGSNVRPSTASIGGLPVEKLLRIHYRCLEPVTLTDAPKMQDGWWMAESRESPHHPVGIVSPDFLSGIFHLESPVANWAVRQALGPPWFKHPGPLFESAGASDSALQPIRAGTLKTTPRLQIRTYTMTRN